MPVKKRQTASEKHAAPLDKTRIEAAEIQLPSQDISAEIAFFCRQLGFRLEEIFPADNPAMILLSGHGLRLRLDRQNQLPAGRITLALPAQSSDLPAPMTAPNGTEIHFAAASPPLQQPETRHQLLVRRLVDSDSWIIGRAGMHYRDLIPGRLGGAVIASHIRIPEGGPVPDMVHYHKVGFQLIYCLHGWVKVVYEDQGDPITLQAGDCVTQPPQIRHRVLESSDNLEVLEIGVPAEHITVIDHALKLPTGKYLPERLFDGQVFVHHQAAQASWQEARLPGWTAMDTGIAKGTAGAASVQLMRPDKGTSAPIAALTDADILFGLVASGSMQIGADGQRFEVSAGDGFALPPGQPVQFSQMSPDLSYIEVSLPGSFQTRIA
jgi:quercetin dioxygenase-like cupin family protein